MTAKEMQQEAAVYLSRYRTAKAEVKDIEQRIKTCRAEMLGVKGISYENGDMPKAPSHTSDLSDYIVRLDALLTDWQAAQRRALDTMCEISAAINGVTDDNARRVLMLHYVDGMTFDQVAAAIPCGINSVYRWRRIGLREIKVGSK